MAGIRHVGATEIKLEPHEELYGDSNDENGNPTQSRLSGNATHANEKDDEQDNKNFYTIEYESEEEEGRPFVPSIKIKRIGHDSLLITTVVLKDVALTSDLFLVLEEERLDVVFENQYRTETKVAHTLQVKVQPGYNIDALERRLCVWAGKQT